MNVTTLQDYRERHANDTKIGSVAMISARQSLVPLSQIKADLEAAGLGDLVPKPTAISDLWRKATSSAQRKGVEIGDKRLNILIRKVKDDEKEIVRSVVIETVDAKGKVLHFEESAHVIFYKETERMRVKRLVDVGGVADDVIQQLRDAYAARITGADVCVNGKWIPGYTKDQDDIRTLLTEGVKSLKAVPIRETGGVFFVPPAGAEKLAKLEKVARGWTGAECHSLPLIEDDPEDPRKQQRLVQAGVTASVLTDVDALLAEFREHKDNLSSRRQASIVRRHREIKARVMEYRELLEDNLEDAVTRLNLLALTMPKVIDAVPVAA